MTSSGTASSRYTVDALIPDCVGRYITSSGGAIQLSSLINGRTYASCWQAFIYWIATQYQLQSSCNLAPIGIIHFGKNDVSTTSSSSSRPRPSSSAYENGNTSLNPDGTRIQPTFRFLRPFFEEFGLTVSSTSPSSSFSPPTTRPGDNDLLLSSQDIAAQRMNILTLSKMAGCEPQVFRTALSHLMRRMGEVLASRENVYFNFGIGALIGQHKVISFIFHDDESNQVC